MTADPAHTLFRTEYELEMERWLRRRFRSVGVCYAILTGVVLLQRAIMLLNSDAPGRWPAMMVTIAAAALSLAIIAHVLLARHWTKATREQLLRGASTMILLLGAVSLVKSYFMEFISPQHRTEFIVPMFFWHLIACMFLPWTPRESLRPFVPLLAIWAVGVLLHTNVSWASRISSVVFSPLVLLPGVLWAALRLHWHSESFRSRMIGTHFLTMRQELAKARSIHESMFPAAYDDGHVRFEFAYTPMREIGGDYVHLHVSDHGVLHVTLMDVTGHGLAAALTVNRLYGELERIRGENLDAEPAEVLALLNRYIHLTMARHNIFVTALSMTLDPYRGRLLWANAGHPPAFLRGANGVVTPLPATTVLLGALDGREFEPGQKAMELSPGDVVVLYTDGAFESRNRLDERIGLRNLTQLMQTTPPPAHWPHFITGAVQRHTGGRADDDILVAALTFVKPRVAEIIRAEFASTR